MNNEIKQEAPFAEGGTPVGGFTLTARLDDTASSSRKFPRLPVLSLANKPLVLRVTIKNITDRSLQYIIDNGRPEYRVDVRGGAIRYGKKQEFLKEETLRPSPAYTLLGARLYNRPSSFVARSTSYQQRTIEPGESVVVRIVVDYLYDLTESGLYQVSVRHLFPVNQLNEQGGGHRGANTQRTCALDRLYPELRRRLCLNQLTSIFCVMRSCSSPIA